MFKTFCDEECLNPSDFNEATLRTNKEGRFSGLLYILDCSRETSDYYIRARHQYADEGYRADLGFQSQIDRTVPVIGGGYNWWNENSWWNRINIDGDWDIRMTYQFVQRQFFRVTVAYSDISRNQDNYELDVNANSEDIGFQLLYSYKLNPLSKFFIGYADSAYNNDDLNKLKTNNQFS